MTCKVYHIQNGDANTIVFTLKYRREEIYAKNKAYIGKILRELSHVIIKPTKFGCS